MNNLTLTLIFILLTSAASFAYPPQHSPSRSSLYSEGSKRSLDNYSHTRTYYQPSYSNVQANKTTLAPYRADESATLTDFTERDPHDGTFEMYNNIQDKYEKTPRFSF